MNSIISIVSLRIEYIYFWIACVTNNAPYIYKKTNYDYNSIRMYFLCFANPILLPRMQVYRQLKLQNSNIPSKVIIFKKYISTFLNESKPVVVVSNFLQNKKYFSILKIKY